MANLFQEQMLKAGLVDSKQVNKAKQEKRKQNKQKRSTRGGKPEKTQQQQQIQQQQAEKRQRDQQLNEQRKRDAFQKSLAAQVRQLIDNNKVTLDENGVAYNFTDANKIKTLYMSESTRTNLTNGQLKVVRDNTNYAVVATEIAERIAERDADAIVPLNVEVENDKLVEDDPYADYQVPDDLIW